MPADSPFDNLKYVGMYAGDHPQMVASVKVALQKRKADLLEQSISIQNWDKFCEWRGKVLGLEDALGIVERAEKILNER